jgi:4-hydroxybenzoate polyprenyltransferase
VLPTDNNSYTQKLSTLISMFRLSNWKHLRVPFSYFLLPIFLFPLAFNPNIDPLRFFWVFVALHLFLYPSSNGYNSYFDKDEKSIGGLKNPPQVTLGLYYLSLLFFLLALATGLILSWQFSSMLLVYSAVSMAYSHPYIRLKKFPYISWIIAGLFQGYFTFCMAYAGLSGFGWEVFVQAHVVWPGLLTSLMLWASYPLTQVYQHEEDSRRGDVTLSLRLGIKGTFLFSSLFFLVAGAAFCYFFLQRGQTIAMYYFLLAMLPVVLYFFIWFWFVNRSAERYVTYSWVMWMNMISATALNVFFIWYFLYNTQLLQVFG